MRTSFMVLCAAALSSSAFAGFTSAVIDDFSGSAGLGFTRTDQGSATVSGGMGSLVAGNGGFQYIAESPGYIASGFTGISLKVSGDLGNGTIRMSAIGDSLNFVAMDVDLGATLSNGYAWITFDQIDAAVGNDPGTITSVMQQGFGFWGIGLYLSGTTGSVQIDDFEFRVSAVPAPGALALLGVAGVVGARRRR